MSDGYKGCTPAIYTKRTTKAAQEAGVDVSEVLAGSRKNMFSTVRWRVWRGLVKDGFSYFSIGKCSGFDHTSVRYACLRQGDPLIGRNRGVQKVPAVGRPGGHASVSNSAFSCSAVFNGGIS